MTRVRNLTICPINSDDGPILPGKTGNIAEKAATGLAGIGHVEILENEKASDPPKRRDTRSGGGAPAKRKPPVRSHVSAKREGDPPGK